MDVSVPYSQGHRLRQLLDPFRVWVDPSFQSPIHRVIDCDRRAEAIDLIDDERFSPLFTGSSIATDRKHGRPIPASFVSVPYSQGHRLRPASRSDRPHRRRAFQSPIHRVIDCDFRMTRGDDEDEDGFSPLFTGSSIATYGPGLVANGGEPRFQSPMYCSAFSGHEIE
jgi:hypothetical protein